MKQLKQLFGRNIEPRCLYCEFGKQTSQQNIILCRNKGIVNNDYYCKKYRYSPFKRTPKRMANLPIFDREDFIL